MIHNPILSIAGFDNSGGAGLQADLKTFSAFNCYGMSVVTAIAVQNTTGVKQCHMIDTDIIKAQLDSIFEDIPPKVIKIGMLFNKEIIDTIYNFITSNNINIPIVLDPVMMAKSGSPLLLPDGRQAMIEKLIPLAYIITPNLPEALELIQLNPQQLDILSQQEIAQEVMKLGCYSVLVKGGHYETEDAQDVLLTKDQEGSVFSTPRINSKNTHGTGCTLSAAITASLAYDFSLKDSVSYAKKYLTQAILSGKDVNVGQGFGPTDHLWFLDSICDGKLL